MIKTAWAVRQGGLKNGGGTISIEADRRPHVIGKHEERRAERHGPAVRGQAVHDRTHRVLAHAEMQIAARVGPTAAVGTLLVAGGRARRAEVSEAL